MIQRLQSLLLLLALLAAASLFALPVYDLVEAGNPSVKHSVMIFATTGQGDPQLLLASRGMMAITIFICCLSAITIFSYSKRMKQVKLCNILLITHFFLLLLIVFTAIKIAEGIQGDFSIEIRAGIIMELLSILLTVAARHYILKDEALVRSADRLR